MDHWAASAGVFAFMFTFGGLWWPLASVAAPTAALVWGEEHARTLDVGRGDAVSWVWEVRLALDDPEDVRVRAFIPFAEDASRDAEGKVDAWVETRVNNVSASRFRHTSSLLGGIRWPEVPRAGDNIDWSALRPGENVIAIHANFTVQDERPRAGMVDVRAGPMFFQAWYADADRDGVEDARQPVPFFPTYLVAGVAGVFAGGLGFAGVRWLRKRS